MTNESTENDLGRRQFLRLNAVAGIASLGTTMPVNASESGELDDPLAKRLQDNIYTRLLGVRPHLATHEHVTRLGGNRMSTEVVQAMAQANEYFVDMHELSLAVGRQIADLLGAEDALITSGAFSAMILGGAACLTGEDPVKVAALPRVNWKCRECLIPHGHRFVYERAYRCAGMEIVEAGKPDDLPGRITEKTAMLAGLAIVEKQDVFAPPLPISRAHKPGPDVIQPDELIQVGKQANVPVMIDMASDIPPVENLSRFIGAADLVAISGGKALGGPQATGILAGRSDLIAAARLHAYPNEQLGRGMKVGKEAMVGLVVAVQQFLKSDYGEQVNTWNQHAKWLADQLQGIPGLSARYSPNTMGYADVDLSWDTNLIPLSPNQVRQQLHQQEPRISYLITVRTRLLREEELKLVARTLRQFFIDRTRNSR